MSGTDDIRGWAMALPDVTERQHHLFKVPQWRVRGKTFVGMGKDGTTVVCCVSETEANQLAEAEPERYAAVRRRDARNSFLGVQVELDDSADERLKSLVEHAWRRHAPKRLVAQFDQDTDSATADGAPTAGGSA